MLLSIPDYGAVVPTGDYLYEHIIVNGHFWTFKQLKDEFTLTNSIQYFQIKHLSCTQFSGVWRFTWQPFGKCAARIIPPEKSYRLAYSKKQGEKGTRRTKEKGLEAHCWVSPKFWKKKKPTQFFAGNFLDHQVTPGTSSWVCPIIQGYWKKNLGIFFLSIHCITYFCFVGMFC